MIIMIIIIFLDNSPTGSTGPDGHIRPETDTD